ncbi:SDR family NAD(P)-dependent oxidoreductase [Diplocloster agilis]|uniref:SDR family NAD(P)-dependent oxidoreductase n=1 Tax=Diplocloster agilis TaxID=2850323 RepID=UPI0008204E64|nr:SDR family NAD(P)-dependent oxidoreductase [Suonthocola fibrivorans]MCU6735627.1 SDR family oxidoreductase [Suonthocola fibrivorans]SCJ78308.1 3-oxoacyl-[acyl-carrier-protein] reductase FabG [uncultured Clostridium sp.]
MNIDLTGKTAVITGGSGAIGMAMCEYYIQSGANVAVVDIDRTKGEEAAAQLRKLGGNARYFFGDVSDGESMESMCAQVLDTFGGIEILVNNAGVNVGPQGRALIQDFTEENWHKIMKVDLDGVFYCSRPVIRHMAARKYGRIINIASCVGQVPMRNQCAFTAAKAAVIHLTKTMAVELGADGILVNCICPGSVIFEGTRALFYADQERSERMLAHIPLGRPAEPREIAGTAVFLSSDEMTYMTGSIITVDGGWTCGFARDF